MATYLLQNRVLGSSQAIPMWDDLRPVAGSIGFVCPTCGELWGRIAVDFGEWTASKRCCPRHSDYFTHVGGSFLAPWQHTYQHLPVEVLTYEFLLHHDHFLRTQT